MSKIHPQNLIYLIICCGGVLAFVVLFIFPNSGEIADLEKELDEVQFKIQEQELLNPIYRELIKQAQKEMPKELPVPETGNIEKRTISELNEVFAQLAKDSDVRFEGAVPDASSYLDESGLLTISVTFSGDFFNFRKLLIEIFKLPYLNTISQLILKTENSTKRLQLKLSLNQE